MNQKTLLPSPNSETLHTTLLRLNCSGSNMKNPKHHCQQLRQFINLENNSNKSLIAQNLGCECVDVTFKWVQIGHGHATDKEQLSARMLGVSLPAGFSLTPERTDSTNTLCPHSPTIQVTRPRHSMDTTLAANSPSILS